MALLLSLCYLAYFYFAAPYWPAFAFIRRERLPRLMRFWA